MGRFLMQVLWPSFLVAAAADGVFFSLFDPQDLLIDRLPVNIDRVMVYTLGFFVFWALLSLSSGLTYLLLRDPADETRRNSPRSGA